MERKCIRRFRIRRSSGAEESRVGREDHRRICARIL